MAASAQISGSECNVMSRADSRRPSDWSAGARNAYMEPIAKSTFDPKTYLAKVGDGKIIAGYRKNRTVFSQGDRADAVFYIQKGKVKLAVVSSAGREAVIAVLDSGDFPGRGVPGRQAAALVHGLHIVRVLDHPRGQTGHDAPPP